MALGTGAVFPKRTWSLSGSLTLRAPRWHQLGPVKTLRPAASLSTPNSYPWDPIGGLMRCALLREVENIISLNMHAVHCIDNLLMYLPQSLHDHVCSHAAGVHANIYLCLCANWLLVYIHLLHYRNPSDIARGAGGEMWIPWAPARQWCSLGPQAIPLAFQHSF